MRSLRALLATLMLLAGVALSTVAPAPAGAQEPESLVSIRLDSFTPSLPQRSSRITVTGVVTNTSKKPIFHPRAYFWRNQAPITDQEGFDQALQSASNDPIGARKIASYDNLFDEDDPYLNPGATEDFRLEVNVTDLELSPTSGIYLMGVHVLQNEKPPAVGRARVFVPLLSQAPRNRLQMTTIVVLNSRPSLVTKGVFADDHLAREIAPNGRLTKLLSAADESKVSFAVDPALIEELESMRSGYRVLEDGGGDGTGKADAQEWLDDFAELSGTRDGYRTLYGSPDVAALVHAGDLDVLEAAEEAAKAVPSTASLPLLVWPGNGAADLDTVVAATALRPAAILLSDSSTRAADPLLQPVVLPDLPATKIVNYTSAAFGGGPAPDPSDTAVHLQQRLLTESWLQAATEPAGATLGHVRIISNAAQAESDDESVKAPWVEQTTLTQLLGSTPSTWDQVLHYSDTNRSKELRAAQLVSLERLGTSWTTWQDLLVDKTSARADAAAAVARAASVRMRRSPGPFKAVVTAQQNELDQRLNAVQISATRQVLTPQRGVSFPITIRNTLDPSDNGNTSTNQIRVQMRFTSANSQRLTVQPIPLTTINAGQSFQGNAAVEAQTNGTVRVTARLYTASGRAVGRPATIDVKATQAGTVGWFIAIGAGLVLVGTTALRIRQVTRARAKVTPAGSGPIDATRSAPPPDSPDPDPEAPDASDRSTMSAARASGSGGAGSIDV